MPEARVRASQAAFSWAVRSGAVEVRTGGAPGRQGLRSVAAMSTASAGGAAGHGPGRCRRRSLGPEWRRGARRFTTPELLLRPVEPAHGGDVGLVQIRCRHRLVEPSDHLGRRQLDQAGAEVVAPPEWTQARWTAGAPGLDAGANRRPTHGASARARPVLGLRRGPDRRPGGGCGAAAGVRPAANDGAGDRAPGDRAHAGRRLPIVSSAAVKIAAASAGSSPPTSATTTTASRWKSIWLGKSGTSP